MLRSISGDKDLAAAALRAAVQGHARHFFHLANGISARDNLSSAAANLPRPCVNGRPRIDRDVDGPSLIEIQPASRYLHTQRDKRKWAKYDIHRARIFLLLATGFIFSSAFAHVQRQRKRDKALSRCTIVAVRPLPPRERR